MASPVEETEVTHGSHRRAVALSHHLGESDGQLSQTPLETPRPPLAVTADKAYDSEKVRQQIKDEGTLPVIPSRSNATPQNRNYFCRIKDWRRIATRYDKLARNFLAAKALVGTHLWIKL